MSLIAVLGKARTVLPPCRVPATFGARDTGSSPESSVSAYQTQATPFASESSFVQRFAMSPTVATSTRADTPLARTQDAPKRKREPNARVVRPPRRPASLATSRARRPPSRRTVRPLPLSSPQSARFLATDSRRAASFRDRKNRVFRVRVSDRTSFHTRKRFPRGGRPQCRVVGCEETYSSVHECRARACTAHCSAEAVELEGCDPGTQWRYCYQCHKFHELEAFSSPDGSALALHNCYGSQQRRLKRRKLKEQEKLQDVSAKKLAEEMDKRNEDAHAGLLNAMPHRDAGKFFASVVSAAGPWPVAGSTIAARRLGAKTAISTGKWSMTSLSAQSSADVSPREGAAVELSAPGAPSLLSPLDDELILALDEYIAKHRTS